MRCGECFHAAVNRSPHAVFRSLRHLRVTPIAVPHPTRLLLLLHHALFPLLFQRRNLLLDLPISQHAALCLSHVPRRGRQFRELPPEPLLRCCACVRPPSLHGASLRVKLCTDPNGVDRPVLCEHADPVLGEEGRQVLCVEGCGFVEEIRVVCECIQQRNHVLTRQRRLVA